MKITREFLELIAHSDTLNKAQCAILGLEYPPSSGWMDEVVGREISTGDTNLLIMLRGKLALTAQKQIESNYKALSAFHNPPKAKEPQSVEVSGGDSSRGLEIYCDGACQGNPGEAASGLAIYGRDRAHPTLIYGDYNPRGTNNTAELNALYKALLLASEYEGDASVTILSDSKYSIDCITTWAYGWKRNGWKKKGGEIKNLKIIRQAHSLYEELKSSITIRYVKGHAGIEGNELADRMALKAIEHRATQYRKCDYTTIEELL